MSKRGGGIYLRWEGDLLKVGFTPSTPYYIDSPEIDGCNVNVAFDKILFRSN